MTTTAEEILELLEVEHIRVTGEGTRLTLHAPKEVLERVVTKTKLDVLIRAQKANLITLVERKQETARRRAAVQAYLKQRQEK